MATRAAVVRRKPHDLENLHEEEKEANVNALECVACRRKTHFTSTLTARDARLNRPLSSRSERPVSEQRTYFSRCYFLSRDNVCQNLRNAQGANYFDKINFYLTREYVFI